MGWDSTTPATMREVSKRAFILKPPRHLFQTALSMFVKGGFEITNGFSSENENALFFLDLGFTVNDLKDDLFSLFLNLEDRACLQAHVITHIFGNNNPSEPVQCRFHRIPPFLAI
jgi:hypothetical protein